MMNALFPLFLGMAHCLETDHVLAVASVSSKQSKLSSLFYQGVTWGVGHSIPIVCIGIIYTWSRFFLLQNLPLSLEIIVGVVLILAGVYRLYKKTKEKELHNNHIKAMLLVGLLHGFAGSAGIVLAHAGAQTTIATQLGYFLTFSIGTILGMGVISMGLGNINQWFYRIKKWQWLIPIMSIMYGAFLIYTNI